MNLLFRGFIVLMLLMMGHTLLAQETMPPEGLYVINADGTNLQSLLIEPNTIYWGPAWSHAGTQIAFTVSQVGTIGGELYLANSDGTSLTPLTRNGRNNYFPVWSPDDQTITFISQDANLPETSEVYVIQADGSGETRLTDNGAWDYGMSWSPDGQRIAFGSEQSGTWGIYIMNADGSDVAPLTESAQGNSPTWSPDGQRIAFTSDRDGDDDIYIANLDGSNQRNLTNNMEWDDLPVWSPDGNRIAFNAYRGERSGIYILTLDTGETQSLTPDLDLSVGFPTWSPDGSKLLFHARALTAEERGGPNPSIIIVGGVLIVGGFAIGMLLRSRRRIPLSG